MTDALTLILVLGIPVLIMLLIVEMGRTANRSDRRDEAARYWGEHRRYGVSDERAAREWEYYIKHGRTLVQDRKRARVPCVRVHERGWLSTT